MVPQAVLHLVVDLADETGETAERRLYMAAGAAKTVIQIKMAEGRIKVVRVHQLDDTPPEPDTFGVTGRTVDDLGGFGEFVGFSLIIFCGIGCTRSRLAGLVGV